VSGSLAPQRDATTHAPPAVAARFTSIDILKAGGIIVVIWIHAFQEFGDTEPFIIRRLAFLTGAAVPAFFFASGFLNAQGRSLSLRQFAERRLMRLLVPYVVASLVALAFRRFVFSEPITRLQAVFELATGGAWGIYYFIPMLLGAAVVGQGIFRFRSLAVPVFVLFWVLGVLSYMWIIPFGGLYGQMRNPFRWWGYVFAGWVMAQQVVAVQGLTAVHRRSIGVAALTVAAGIFLYYVAVLPAEWSPAMAALQYVCTYGIVAGVFLLALRSADHAAVRWLSEATYPIYLYHFFIIALVHRWPASPLRDPLAFVLGCVGSVAFVYGGRKVLGSRARLLIG
jgi:peptidoglycan/LPS O-acetylase OafA/YrhL